MTSTEYAFTLPDGSVRFEIVTKRNEVHVFKRMHGAVSAMPLHIWEALQEQAAADPA